MFSCVDFLECLEIVEKLKMASCFRGVCHGSSVDSAMGLWRGFQSLHCRSHPVQDWPIIMAQHYSNIVVCAPSESL